MDFLRNRIFASLFHGKYFSLTLTWWYRILVDSHFATNAKHKMDDEESRLLLSSAEAANGSDTFLFCMPCRLPIRALSARCFMWRMSLAFSLVKVRRNEFDRYILSRSWRPFA